MGSANLRSEERIGLIIALAAHIALVAVLVLRPPTPTPFPLPERMTVTLSDDVGLTSTSPEPAAQPALDVAPVLREAPRPPVIAPEPIFRPQPIPRVAAAPARTVAKQAAKPSATARQAAAPTPPRRPSASTGGSRIGNDFLRGVPGVKTSGTTTNPPAAAIGPQVRSAIGQAIARQLKPHWVAPQGPDVEQLVTVVRFRLNRDGSLAGTPEVVRQTGETPANRTQKGRHAEQAIRAVRLAAPFNLPEEYYSGWQVVTSNFDRRLSQ
ncbi:MAG TPA: hypothetical protein VHG29_02120 [Novosphingobium sp.]|nr:hypothetical protein [Novosphingobium sp.]